MKKLNILVTGGAGYVGSVLIPTLIEDGHFVRCLDRFFFGMDYLNSEEFKGKLELIRDDIRWFDPESLNDVDVVMDLAALSNDPIGDLDPSKTFEINHLGRKRVANLAKKAGVPKYILASSASIYGHQKETVDEKSKVFPLTSYSKANRKAEIDVLKLNDHNFTVTALRFSSLYGISPMLRFDIAVNSMVLEVYKNKKIVVRGKNNKRPFMHVKDAVKAYQITLKEKEEKISGQIFNVGSDEQNYTIGNLAKEIGDSIGIDYELILGDNYDHRSYIASFKKIKEILGFYPHYDIKDGAKDIYHSLKNGKVSDSIKTITLKWYKHIQTNPKMKKAVALNGKIL